MIKKSFRLMLLGAFALMSSVFVACDKYDDDIQGLQGQIDELKAKVTSLQSAIDGGAVITSVTTNANGIVVKLSNGQEYPISNGKDGKNGSVVEIGANGNWFIDGADTGKPAQGEDGKDADTVYYYPGENGNWVKVTINAAGEKTEVEEGGSWLPAGTVTAVYANGVLTLYNVEGYEGGLVVTGAAHIASLAVVPTEMLTSCLGMPVFTNYVIEVEEEFVASNNLEMTYRVNPAGASVEGVEFSFVNRTVKTKAFAGADATDLLSFEKVVASTAINGAINVTAKVAKNPVVERGEFQLFALKAVSADGCEVVSDYAVYEADVLTELELVNVNKQLKSGAETTWYHHIIDGANDCDNVVTEDPADTHFDAFLQYDSKLDLLSVVNLAEVEKINDFISKYGFEVSFKFDASEEYLGVDGKTNQNQFVVLNGSELTVNTEWLKGEGKAAVNRTPYIYVEALINGKVVDAGYIKIQIVEEEVEEVAPEAITITVGPAEFEYSQISADSKMNLPWDRFNVEAYEVLKLTSTKFWSIYTENEIEAAAGVTVNYNALGEDATSTDVATVTFDANSVKLGEGVATLTLMPNDPRYAEVIVKFIYNITHKQSFPNLNPDYLLAEATTVETLGDLETVRVKGKLVNNVWALQAEVKEFCEDYLQGYTVPGNHGDIRFYIAGQVENGKLIPNTTAQLVVDGVAVDKNATANRNADIMLTEALGENEEIRTYVLRMTQRMYNNEVCVKYFAVQFQRPFVLTTSDVTLKTYTALPDQVDVAENVVVYDRDGKVIFEDGDVTAYAANTYKFNKDMFVFSYSMPDLDASWGNEGNKKLTIDGSVIKWYNGGGDLQENKTTSYYVTLDIPGLAAAREAGKVTVLSTENSKN